MIAAILTLAAAPVAAQQAPVVTFEAPTIHIAGRPYVVELTIEAPEQGATAAGWWLSPAGFLVDGEPVQRREDAALVSLPPNAVLNLTFDLGPHIAPTGDFELTFAEAAYEGGPIEVMHFEAAPTEGEEAIDFMTVDADRLDDFLVVLETNRGTMVTEFWPDDAPGHVRNFLDLSASGFYDGTLFHRVIPGFMAQGGDPYTKDASKSRLWGTGGGPRQLTAEFNDRAHVRGVLSAARSASPDSASSQFFLVHAEATNLDGQYTAFGKLIKGEEVIDKIVTTPRSAADRPNTPQQLVRATVVLRN